MNIQHTFTDNLAETSNVLATDMELVLQVNEGGAGAFELIMRRHNQRLYRIARSIVSDEHEAMDVVQDTYIKAYYQLRQFKGPDGFASWLSRIARNEAMMRIRKSKRIEYTLDDTESGHKEAESTELQPQNSLANNELRTLLEEAIDKLSIDYRGIYVLRAVQQLTTRETAKVLELSEDVVKMRYLRAKRLLRESFEKHLEKTGLEIFEFAGYRCDLIVHNVLAKLALDKKAK